MRVIWLFVAALAAFGGHADAFAQTKLARVGVLTFDAGTREPLAGSIKTLHQTLADQGWVEGKTVTFVMRHAQGDPARFGEAAAELVRQKVDVIYAVSAPALRAAFAATKSIPIVGNDYTNDPVAAGYVKTYAHPGGNVTGVFLDAPEFAGKWLELLREIVPQLTRVVALWDPAPGDTHARALTSAAQSFGIQLQVVEVRKPEDIDNAAAAFTARAQAIVILPSPMLYVENPRLVNLAITQRVPATSMNPYSPNAGVLLAYGPDEQWTMGRLALMVGKVLRGTKPADLPIERPVKFDLVVNLKTAKQLNLKIPDAVVTRADRVIR
jgi:putative tryptophan/tyrosine transport system substrate-binding protein